MMWSYGNKKRNNVSVVIIGLLFIIMISSSVRVSAEYFLPNIRVDDAGASISYQVGPSIAIDNQGTVHIVWEDWRNDADGYGAINGGVDGVDNPDIYYANSTDGGITFSPNRKVNINTNPSWQGSPSIAIDSTGIIHVVWTDYRNDADGFGVSGGGTDGANNADIYYANSTDGGITWSEGKRVNDDPGLAGQGTSFRSIAIDKNDNVHVVWLDERNIPQSDIYYANSTNGGITFSENKKINDVSKGSWDASIAIDDNSAIYVVWSDDRDDITKSDIFFSKSMNGGLSFSPNKKVNDDNLPLVEQRTSYIAAGDGIIGIVWADGRNPGYESVYFVNSTDDGENFSINRRVDDDNTAPFKGRPVLAIGKDKHICIAWHDKRNGEYDIYFANSTDGGNAFSKNQRVNDDTTSEYQGFPSIALNNYGSVYIAWTDRRNGDRDIYLSRSNLPPSIANPISPPYDSILTDNTPTLVVASDMDLDNDTIYYNFTISDQPDAESGTNYSSDWIASTSWIAPPLPDGKWYWHVYTSDMWNITAPDWVWNFTIDMTPPAITNLQPPDASITNDNTMTISADYSDPSGVNASNVLLKINGIDETSNAIVTTSSITYVPGSALLDGTYTIYLEVKDNVDNQAMTTWAFTIDTVSPIISNLQPQDSSTTIDNTPVISAAYSDLLGINVSSVLLKVDDVDVTLSSIVTGNDVSYIPAVDMTDGSHTVFLNVSDTLGNFATKAWTFAIDTTPPIITDLQPPNLSITTNDTPTINANYSDDSGIDVNNVLLKIDDTDVSTLSMVTASGVIFVPISALNDGLHTVYLDVRDSLGNLATAIWNFTIDSTPPAISNLQPPKDSTITDTTPTISCDYGDSSGINVSSVLLKVDGVDFTSFATITASGITYTPGAAFAVGIHAVYIEVKDIYGNAATATWSFYIKSESADQSNFIADYWWILLALVIVIVVAIILLLIFKKKRKPEDQPISE